MQTKFRYRGRTLSGPEIEAIRPLITAHPGLSRRQLSVKLCQAWNWVQANGHLRAMVARSLMLQLHRAGLIVLPVQRVAGPNNAVRHRSPLREPSVAVGPLAGSLAELGPLEIRQVRRTPEEALFGRLLQTHHYLGYRRPVGEQVKYLVYGRGQPLACLAWSSAPRHLGPRDRFIGWSIPQRRAHIHLLAYNTRFLILPWARVPHLASHLLGRVARRISSDWQQLYEHPIYLLETFIEPARFRGTCYRAANWLPLGLTTGRGKADLTHQANRSRKELWVQPLGRNFRQRLCREGHE
jgi:hypothetical protein